MEWKRNCPTCGKELFYKSRDSLRECKKGNRSCRSCVGKERRQQAEERKRKGFSKKCPECDKKMTYTRNYSLQKSIKENIKCVSCSGKTSKRTIKKMSEEERKEKTKQQNKKYCKNNKEKISQCQKEYRSRPEVKEWKKKYYKLEYVKQKKNAYMREYIQRPEVKERNKKYNEERKKDPEFRKKRNENIKKRREKTIIRLSHNISTSIRESLKSKKHRKNGRHWEKLVGYTIYELKKHLEKLFQPGMTWENYGKEWHIDHITPISFFIFTSTNDVEFKYCWSLYNLQPLWAEENIEKRDKILPKYFKNNSVL